MTEMKSFCEIIDKLQKEKTSEKTSVKDVVSMFKRRGFGPLLLIPALFLILPTGAIPGAPVLCSILMIFITVQILIGNEHPWFPKKIMQIEFDGDKMDKGLDKIKPAVKLIDRFTGPRLTWLITPVSKRIIGFICLLLAIAVIPVGIIPFAVDPIALAIIFFALGFSVNDGLLIATGIVIAVAAVVFSIYLLL